MADPTNVDGRLVRGGAADPVTIVNESWPAVTVNDAQARGPVTDKSGVTVASTSTLVMAQNLARKFLFFQNLSGSTMYINYGAAATNGSPSIQVGPSETWVSEKFFIPTDAVYVWAAESDLAFTAKEG